MKTLTICQPYASLVAAGIKDIENRRWGTSYRGPLLIHAGKSTRYFDDNDMGWEREWVLLGAKYGDLPVECPFGAIVGVAELFDCRPFYPSEHHGPWAEGPYLWKFKAARAFAKPVPMNGARGLWEADWVAGDGEGTKDDH